MTVEPGHGITERHGSEQVLPEPAEIGTVCTARKAAAQQEGELFATLGQPVAPTAHGVSLQLCFAATTMHRLPAHQAV